ncbi:MAG: hypothetical protein MUQ10_01975 [Anaerolineae bacterium]|nr:hypothetical protein [Anaerolineae bacterium]
MRTFKEEGCELSNDEDYHDALRQLGRFLEEVCMHKRLHSSLGYLPPAEFEEHWQHDQLQVAFYTNNRPETVQFLGGTTLLLSGFLLASRSIQFCLLLSLCFVR